MLEVSVLKFWDREFIDSRTVVSLAINASNLSNRKKNILYIRRSLEVYSHQP